MNKTLVMSAIITSVILVAGTVGFVISAPDAFAGNPVPIPEKDVTICHKPGTPAELTITVSVSALPAHLAHGDFEGTCELPPQAAPFCQCDPTVFHTIVCMDNCAVEKDDFCRDVCEDAGAVFVSASCSTAFCGSTD